MIKTMFNPLESLPLNTVPAKKVVALVVWPLGNEYPVAVVIASFTGCTLESRIHGRYTQAKTFKKPLTKYAPACDMIKNSPNFLSKHQYTRVINIKIGKSSPKIEQNRKKELKIPPVSSLINCKNNNGSIKMLILPLPNY